VDTWFIYAKTQIVKIKIVNSKNNKFTCRLQYGGGNFSQKKNGGGK
jgi:hypothetical protein